MMLRMMSHIALSHEGDAAGLGVQEVLERRMLLGVLLGR